MKNQKLRRNVLVLFLVALFRCTTLFLTAGCTKVNPQTALHTPSAAEAKETNRKQSTEFIQSPLNYTSDAAKPVFDPQAIQGKVKNIYYGESNKVIVSADKLYL